MGIGFSHTEGELCNLITETKQLLWTESSYDDDDDESELNVLRLWSLYEVFTNKLIIKWSERCLFVNLLCVSVVIVNWLMKVILLKGQMLNDNEILTT